MIELVDPDPRYHASWLEAAREFDAEGTYMHGSGLLPPDLRDEDAKGPLWRPDALADPDRFAAFCADMVARRLPEHTPPGLVPDTKLFVVEDGRFLGSTSIRHELNAGLLEVGGHIGYSVRPSARRRGVATETLRLSLGIARGLGIDPALVTCDDDNVASLRTIERNGGVLEDVRQGKRRYWIATG